MAHPCVDPFRVQTNAHSPILAAATALIEAQARSACPKCGTIKRTGKLSCCTRGGAWFNNCGDPGDPKFDHTWLEGMQACTGFMSLFSSKTQVLLRHKRSNGTKEQNDLQQKIVEFTVGHTSSMGSQNYKRVCSLLQVTILMNLVNIVLHMY